MAYSMNISSGRRGALNRRASRLYLRRSPLLTPVCRNWRTAAHHLSPCQTTSNAPRWLTIPMPSNTNWQNRG